MVEMANAATSIDELKVFDVNERPEEFRRILFQAKEEITKLEGDLKYWLSPESEMDPKEGIARFHERLLTIHPFANGNGRTSRILTEVICNYEEIQIPTWRAALKDNAENHRNTYISAVTKARRERDFGDLISFIFG